MESASIDAWTAYWHGGRLASCFEGSDAEVRLTSVWNELVDQLPQGARLLDLATGNGTVARSCAARSRFRGLTLQIEAVDAAEIDPPKHVNDPERLFRDIQFRGGVMLESLPYPDASFDAVVSQFGFEYADEAAAAGEVGRVLAPGGRVRLVVHARDGAVVCDIRLRVDRLKIVLAEQGPVTLVRDLARAAEKEDANAVRRLSAQLPRAAALVRQLATRPPPDDAALYYAREFMTLWSRRNRYWPTDIRRSLDGGWASAAGVLARQEQMLTAARSADDVAELCRRLTVAGLAVDGTRGIRDERRGAQIAWLVDAHKPPDA